MKVLLETQLIYSQVKQYYLAKDTIVDLKKFLSWQQIVTLAEVEFLKTNLHTIQKSYQEQNHLFWFL